MFPVLPQFRKWVELTLGWVFVALALAGVLLPLLPTTPFLLLASFLFVRSSPRCHAWLLRNRLLGPFLRDWERHRGVRPAVKWAAVSMALAVTACSLGSDRLSTVAQCVCVGLCGVGIIVVLRLRTIPGTADAGSPAVISTAMQEIPPVA